jgi:hypothetical protein
LIVGKPPWGGGFFLYWGAEFLSDWGAEEEIKVGANEAVDMKWQERRRAMRMVVAAMLLVLKVSRVPAPRDQE